MRTHQIALSGLLLCLSLGSVALLETGCASTRYHRSTGTYIDDKTITARVKANLFRDPLVKATEVDVKTFRGDVQLSGFVDAPEQAQRAAQVASQVPGVHTVINNLEIKPAAAMGKPAANVIGSSGTVTQPQPMNPSPTYSQPSTDNQAPIQNNASSPVVNTGPANTVPENNLANGNTAAGNAAGVNLAAPQNAPNFQISVDNGQATLRGTVANEAQKQDLERRVREIPGVQGVNNSLNVENR